MKKQIGCGTHLEGWTSTFVCGNIDKFTNKLVLCEKCKEKYASGKLNVGDHK